MNIFSTNIRRLGSLLKRKYVSSLIRREGFDFCLIQETKAESVSDNFIFELWGGINVEWSFKPSLGNSGGIISLWRKGKFIPSFSFEGEGFLGVCDLWNNVVVYIINI